MKDHITALSCTLRMMDEYLCVKPYCSESPEGSLASWICSGCLNAGTGLPTVVEPHSPSTHPAAMLVTPCLPASPPEQSFSVFTLQSPEELTFVKSLQKSARISMYNHGICIQSKNQNIASTPEATPPSSHYCPKTYYPDS